MQDQRRSKSKPPSDDQSPKAGPSKTKKADTSPKAGPSKRKKATSPTPGTSRSSKAAQKAVQKVVSLKYLKVLTEMVPSR